MRKDQVYFYTFVALAIVTFVIGYFSMNILLEYSANQFLQSQIESSKREAKEISSLVHFQLEKGLSRETVVQNLQSTLEGTSMESGFVCMFDWSGVEICHPDPQRVGQQVMPGESFVQPLVYNEMNSDDFYKLLKEGEEIGGIRDFSDEHRKSEIIYLYPVENTDWIIAAHANIDHIESQLNRLKDNFILVYSIAGILLVIISFFTVLYIGGLYENNLETKNKELSRELLSLSKLNRDLMKHKKKWSEAENTVETDDPSDHKNRLLTYFKDEIVSIDTGDIAFLYIDHSIVHIRCLNGDKYTINQSLDELSNDLNPKQFFRVNRQFVLSIKSINKIYKYGKNQLKIEVQPPAPDDIIISKNKASEFKNWLNS